MLTFLSADKLHPFRPVQVREKLSNRIPDRDPTAYEIAEKMALPIKKVEFLISLADQEFVSDNALVFDNDDPDDQVIRVSLKRSMEYFETWF